MWEISISNPSTSEPVDRGHQGPRRGLMRRESAIRAAEIFISTSSEEADEATKLPKLPIIPLI